MNHYQQQYLDDIPDTEGYEPSEADINTCVDALLSNKELHFGKMIIEPSDVAELIADDNEFIWAYTLLSVKNQKDEAKLLWLNKEVSAATELVTLYMQEEQISLSKTATALEWTYEH